MFITELLANLGEHFAIVAVGCVEVAAAVSLFFASMHRKNQKKKPMQLQF